MWGLLAGLLWVVSFITFPTKANGFWLPKDMAWLVGSFLLASSPWWNPPSRPGLRLPALGWMLSWVMLSFAWYVLWPQMTIPQAAAGVQRSVSMRWYVSPILPTLTIVGSLLALDALVRHTDTVVRWQRIALHLVRIGSVVSVWALAQRFGLDPMTDLFQLQLGYVSPQSPITMLGNPTVTGYFLAMLTPLCLMFAARRYRLGAFGLLLGAIAVTGSVSSLVAAISGSLVVWGLQRRWRWVGGGVVVLLMGLMGLWSVVSQGWWTNYLNPHGRWTMWQTAWTLWSAHPLNAWIGYGAGSVGALTANGVWDYGFLHNDAFQWLFEFGVIGLGLGVMTLGSAIRGLRHCVWTGASTAWMGSACAYGLLMLTGFPLQIGSLLMVGVVIAAAVLSYCQPSGGRYAEA